MRKRRVVQGLTTLFVLVSLNSFAQNNSQPNKPVVRPQIVPPKVPALEIAPVHDMVSMAAAQGQIHSQVLAGFQDLKARVGSIPQPAADQRPNVLEPWIVVPGPRLADQANAVGNPNITQLAPMASIFANGDQLGSQHGGQSVNDWTIFNAAFFSDPPPGWQDPSDNVALAGLFNVNLSMTSPDPVATLLPTNGGVVGVTATGALAVTSPTVQLVIPCYYLTGWGAFPEDHAHFEVKIELQDTTSRWNQVGWFALDLFAPGASAAGYTSPAGLTAPPTVMNVGAGLSAVPWTIPFALPQVANTLRINLYAALYNVETSATTPDWTFPSPVIYSAGQPDQQLVGKIVSDSTVGHNWDQNQPFQIVLLPTGIGSMPVMPYTIIYIPPGNNSEVNFTTTTSYGDTIQFQYQGQSSTQLANVQGSSFTIGPNTIGFAGIQGNATVGSQTTQTGTLQTTSVNQESLQIASSWTSGWDIKTNNEANPPPAGDKVQRWDEPFWDDLIDVISNPLFAIWAYPALPDQSAFSAAQIIAYGGGGMADYPLRVGDLFFAEANRTNYQTSDGSITLTPSQCNALISLDPFYQGGAWQGVAPGTGRAAPLRSPGGGIGPGTTWSYDFKDTTTGGNTTTSQTLTSGQVAYQSSFTLANFGATAGPVTMNGGSTQQQTTTTTLTTQYQAQNALTVSAGTEIKGQIGDSAQLKAITVSRDLIFGGIMFQDANEPSTGFLLHVISVAGSNVVAPNKGLPPGGHSVVATKPVARFTRIIH
jgi:hypothetical protein